MTPIWCMIVVVAIATIPRFHRLCGIHSSDWMEL
jgi:hypothetical protein